MRDGQLHVVQEYEYRQVNLQEILRLIIKHLPLQFLQQLLAQWDEQLVDGDIINLEVHYRRHWDLAIIRTSLLHISRHSESFISNYRPRRFDYTTSNP